MNTDHIELFDLGDARRETKQFFPLPIFSDSAYGYGLFPDLG